MPRRASEHHSTHGRSGTTGRATWRAYIDKVLLGGQHCAEERRQPQRLETDQAIQLRMMPVDAAAAKHHQEALFGHVAKSGVDLRLFQTVTLENFAECFQRQQRGSVEFSVILDDKLQMMVPRKIRIVSCSRGQGGDVIRTISARRRSRASPAMPPAQRDVSAAGTREMLCGRIPCGSSPTARVFSAASGS